MKIPPESDFGSIPFVYTDALGTVRTINIQVAAEQAATAQITVHGLNGWSVATEAVIIAAVSAYFQSVAIWESDQCSLGISSRYVDWDTVLRNIFSQISTDQY